MKKVSKGRLRIESISNSLILEVMLVKRFSFSQHILSPENFKYTCRNCAQVVKQMGHIMITSLCLIFIISYIAGDQMLHT